MERTHDWQTGCPPTSHIGGGRHGRGARWVVCSARSPCARGAANDPVRYRRGHRSQRDGDRHLPRVDAKERPQGLWQGIYRRYDLHPRNAGGRDATFFVLKDSPITSTQDLKGKKVGINAFGSAVDLALRVKLKKDGI